MQHNTFGGRGNRARGAALFRGADASTAASVRPASVCVALSATVWASPAIFEGRGGWLIMRKSLASISQVVTGGWAGSIATISTALWKPGLFLTAT
jgi:hypothetical protein